jgi:release factor glutamine methyltransferase
MVCQHTKKYEPKQALFSGEDGLDTYREIFKQIKGKHLQFQYLIGDFGFGQKDSLELLLQ